ncbi:MAG: shikimate kinase [Planctomycetota bacterium]
MHRLTLIGYRGCGKSTIGRLVAARLGLPFADTDAAVESDIGMPIRQFFSERGESAFRDTEAAALARLLAGDRALILATGGGVILRETNRHLLQDHGGLIAYLHAPVAILQERLRRDHGVRPSLTGASIADEVPAILTVREPLYRSIAATVVDATWPSERIADHLSSLMQATPGTRTPDHV